MRHKPPPSERPGTALPACGLGSGNTSGPNPQTPPASSARHSFVVSFLTGHKCADPPVLGTGIRAVTLAHSHFIGTHVVQQYFPERLHFRITRAVSPPPAVPLAVHVAQPVVIELVTLEQVIVHMVGIPLAAYLLKLLPQLLVRWHGQSLPSLSSTLRLAQCASTTASASSLDCAGRPSRPSAAAIACSLLFTALACPRLCSFRSHSAHVSWCLVRSS